MKNIDSYTHLRGESIYLDDIPEIKGTLYGICFDSPVAHGKVKKLDIEEASKSDGVVKIITYRDIPGRNQIGGIVEDEPLLAEGHVHFAGMPIAFIVAETEAAAHNAYKKIKVEIEPLHPITDPREAKEKNELIVPPRTFKCGDSAAAFSKCDYVFDGTAHTGGQEHLYIETQGAYAIPMEHGAYKIFSSTQGPTAVQRACSKVTGIPMHRLEVEVTRLGGGFGGKEDQANTWAALCVVAAQLLQRPVKYSLSRMEDMRMTGNRHPYSSDFKIGLDKDYKILAYEATFYQDAGAAADLSPAVLERTLFHCTNSYFVPNVTATAYSCRTNLPPNTAFRGFGGPQGMFVIESAIAKAADALKVDASLIQRKNLIVTGNEFPYGQKAESEAGACWNKAEEIYDLKKASQEVEEFNQQNKLVKKGLAMMPVCFGISFTKTMMNSARSLVHIYSDGSVNISTAAVEMGQGVNTKIVQVAEKIFSIDPSRIKINSTNTYRIANTAPTAASAAADLNGKATMLACESLVFRLKAVAAEDLKCKIEQISFQDEKILVDGKASEYDWNKMVMSAFTKRVSLSEHSHYATPEIHFDLQKEKGHPFAYHVYGTALVTVTVNCLLGTYTFDSVKVVHDYGKSMNPIIDRGQTEGGIVQGIGWMTIEELIYDKNGIMKSNALSTYKVPDIYSVPSEIAIHFHETEKNNLAIFNSKAVGEPPLMYGIGAFFALRNAIRSFNPSADVAFDAPMTPEKILMNLYQSQKTEVTS